jgi:UDP-N-acetylmuramate dehydrogenase
MNIKEIKKLKVGTVLENVSLKNYTTYKLNGIARALIFPENLECLKKLLTYLKEQEIPFKILGGGSNVIFLNEVYEGILISLKMFDTFTLMDNQVRVGAGYPLMKLSFKTAKAGLTGLEFASGIPGTVGGAIFNNAGAYQSDMGYVVLEATVLTPSLEIETLSNRQMQFHYRTSFFKKHPGYIILDAKIMLKRGKKEEILKVIEDRKKRRLESQPLEYPSAGSVFRNPNGYSAWKLIEEVGYKGVCVGDAMVSEKHANFIINKKNATGKDIVTLIEQIKKEVYDKFKIELVLEQEIIK